MSQASRSSEPSAALRSAQQRGHARTGHGGGKAPAGVVDERDAAPLEQRAHAAHQRAVQRHQPHRHAAGIDGRDDLGRCGLRFGLEVGAQPAAQQRRAGDAGEGVVAGRVGNDAQRRHWIVGDGGGEHALGQFVGTGQLHRDPGTRAVAEEHVGVARRGLRSPLACSGQQQRFERARPLRRRQRRGHGGAARGALRPGRLGQQGQAQRGSGGGQLFGAPREARRVCLLQTARAGRQRLAQPGCGVQAVGDHVARAAAGGAFDRRRQRRGQRQRRLDARHPGPGARGARRFANAARAGAINAAYGTSTTASRKGTPRAPSQSVARSASVRHIGCTPVAFGKQISSMAAIGGLLSLRRGPEADPVSE
ncbi:MAG: hypothetical protein U1F67_06955 [Rubrivivax sp.]